MTTIKRKYVDYTCSSCGRQARRWDTWTIPTCVSCGTSLCSCGFVGFCPNCALSLTSEERRELARLARKVPNSGGGRVECLCCTIVISLAMIFIGSSLSYGQPEMGIWGQFGVVLLIISVSLLILLIVVDAIARKLVTNLHSRIVPNVRFRLDGGMSDGNNSALYNNVKKGHPLMSSPCQFYDAGNWARGKLLFFDSSFKFSAKSVTFSYPFTKVSQVQLNTEADQFKVCFNDGREFLFQAKNARDWVMRFDSYIKAPPVAIDSKSKPNAEPIQTDDNLAVLPSSGILFICPSCRYQFRADQAPHNCPSCNYLFKYSDPAKNDD
jgi:hypothetical protein